MFAFLSFPVFTHLPFTVSYLDCPIGSGKLPLGECAQSQGAPGFHLHGTFLLSFIKLGSVQYHSRVHITVRGFEKKQKKRSMDHHWGGFTPSLCKWKICWNIYHLSNITWTKLLSVCFSIQSYIQDVLPLLDKLLSCLLDINTKMWS